MSIATVEEETDCGCYCEIKLGHERNFQNIVIHSFEFSEDRVATSRLNRRLLAWRKDLFLVKSM